MFIAGYMLILPMLLKLQKAETFSAELESFIYFLLSMNILRLQLNKFMCHLYAVIELHILFLFSMVLYLF